MDTTTDLDYLTIHHFQHNLDLADMNADSSPEQRAAFTEAFWGAIAADDRITEWEHDLATDRLVITGTDPRAAYDDAGERAAEAYHRV